MPYPNFHAFRMKQPTLFIRDSMRSKNITAGVSIIIGKLKSGSGEMVTQAYRFDKSKFTFEESKKWMETNVKEKPILSEKASEQTQSFKHSCILNAARLQAFTDNEILGLINPDVLSELKKKDPHPFLQLYSICHEGTSYPKLLNEKTARPITWTKKAVQSIKNIILKGIKLFKGHNKDNSTNNREDIGVIVDDFQKEIDGKLNHLIITYHPKEKIEEAKKLDVCSQEGIWNFIESAGNLFADSVEKISGIAFANSNEQSPAFPGAKRFGFVQAFNSESSSNLDTSGKEGNSGKEKKGENNFMDLTTVTFNDFMAEFHRRQIMPSQAFKLEEIKLDREFSKEFVNLEKQIMDKVNDNKILSGKLQTYEKDLQKSSAKERIETLSKKLQLTDKMITHVKTVFEEDLKNNEIEDLSDPGIEKYIKTQSRAFSKLLGENKGESHQNNNTDNLADFEDPTKKNNNPLLSEDVNLNEVL